MARTLFERTRLKRTLVVARSFAEAEQQDLQMWARMSPWKRLEVVEFIRQANHANYDPDTGRLPRVLEVIKPPPR